MAKNQTQEKPSPKDISPFFGPVLASAIRWSAEPAEADRAAAVCAFLAESPVAVNAALNEHELEWIKVVRDHWTSYHAAPTPKALSAAFLLTADSLKRGQLDELGATVTSGKQSPATVEDLPPLLGALMTWHAGEDLEKLGNGMRLIATTGAEIQGRTFKGIPDALRWGESRLLKIHGFTPPAKYKGSLQDVKSDVERWESTTVSPIIPSGLTEVDKVVQARLGQFVAIIGGTGSGKTRYCRGWAYNAATAGKRVLHLTLEQTFDEEMKSYLVLHANRVFQDQGITFSKMHAGLITPKQWAFLKKDVAENLANGGLKGLLRVVAPQGRTWEAVKACIETETATHGAFDVCVIDYITLLQVDAKFARDAMAEIITDAKGLAKSYADGHKLLIISPVQSNRTGKSAANSDKGKFDLGAVFSHSIIEFTADLVISVWSDKVLDGKNQVAIGTAKNRFNKSLEPIHVSVETETQTFVDRRTDTSAVNEQPFDDLATEETRRLTGDKFHRAPSSAEAAALDREAEEMRRKYDEPLDPGI